MNPFQRQEYRGSGNHDQQQWWADLNAMRGQKLGDWQTVQESTGYYDQTRTRRFIDTQWGRIYDSAMDDYNHRMENGNESNSPLINPLHTGQGAGFRFGRYHNEHGSDAINMTIDAEGRLHDVAMHRESNADSNTWLAIMATAGIGMAGGFAAIGASEAAQLALAAGSVYASSQAQGGGGSTSAGGGGGETPIEGPTPPPPPPVIEYQDYHSAYAGAARKEHKNPTNLNPDGVTNALFASGNLLLGA